MINSIEEQPEESELQYAIKLNKEGFLPGPIQCICGTKIVYIQHDSSNKTSGVCFRCSNNIYKLKYSIRINSLYAKFPQIKMKDLSDIICFLCLEMNAKIAHKYLKENNNVTYQNRH